MKDNLIALSANLHKYSLTTHSELAQKTPKAATTNRSHHITAATNTPSGGNFISRICAFFHRPNRLGRVVRKFSLRSMIGKIRQVFTPHTTVHTHRFTKQETCPLKSQNKHVDQPSSYSPHVNQFNCIKTPSVHFDQHTSLATPSARSNQPKYLKTPGSGPEQPSYFRSPLGFEYDRILLNRYPHYDESEAIKRLDKEALAHFGITLEALFKYTSFTSNDFYGTRLVWKYPVNGVLPDFGTALPSTPTPASPLPASHTSEPFSSDGIPFPNPYSVPPTIPSSTEIYPRGMDKVLNELKKSLTYRIDALQRWDEQAKIDFKNAFGNTEEKSKNDMLYGLNKMLKVVNEGGNFTLMSREKEEREPGVQAYVMPHDHQHTIYLRDNFFTLPLKLSPEAYKQHTEVVSQTWIIAHELSHFSDILGSEDIRYKLGVAANKFAHHWTPNLTMQQFNADNVAYYLEFSNMENLENEHSIPTPTLDKFSVNLTDRAKAGELDPAWGRESELRQILAILSAKKYNSPVLLGGAGAGKTTTAEGLAYKLFKARTTPDKEVPEALKNVEIRELKLGKLLGQEGAEYRGIVEKSIDGLITELAASKLQGKPIILFVDELHLIVGAGAAGGKNESSPDLANLLKPALSSGAITLIGATTSAEYKKHIEKDAALARRFRPVMINEPSKDAAVSMMQNLIGKLEKMHQVDIPLETATIAVEYAKTYMKGVLPDTSAKLLEDAAINVAAQQNGLVSLSANQLREQIDKLQQKIEVRQKEVKRGNLTAVKPLEDLNTEKKTALKKLNGLQLLWEEQKALVNQIREKQQVISQLAKKHTDREKIQSDLSGLIRTLQEKQDKTEVLVSLGVDQHAIARVVSARTGIPLGKMVKDESAQLATLYKDLKKEVIGQDHALRIIADDILVARMGLKDPEKPNSVAMLVGPSASGKTQTAIALANALYQGNLITVRMSEFTEKGSVSGLKGTTPGYIGYGDPTVLDKIADNPHGVLLLDEFDKAAPEVRQFFFQILDKGEMEDGHGRKIDFKNMMILITANTGSDTIKEACAGATRPTPQELEDKIRPQLVAAFNATPGGGEALLGRMKVLPYYPVTTDISKEIIRKELKSFETLVKQQHTQVDRVKWDLDTEAELVARYARASGAGVRGIQHAITEIRAAVAKELIKIGSTTKRVTFSVHFSNRTKSFSASTFLK